MDVLSYLLGKKSSGGGSGGKIEVLEPLEWRLYHSNITKIPAFTIEENEATTYSSLFNGYVSLEEVDLSKFDTSIATSLQQMFYKCRSLKEVDLSNLGTIQAIDDTAGFNKSGLKSIFNGCTSLKKINLSNFNTTSSLTSTNFDGIFTDCSSLEELDIRSFDFVNKITNSYLVNFFTGVPDGCTIIVADSSQKQKITSNVSRLTNVLTVEEYEDIK